MKFNSQEVRGVEKPNTREKILAKISLIREKFEQAKKRVDEANQGEEEGLGGALLDKAEILYEFLDNDALDGMVEKLKKVMDKAGLIKFLDFLEENTIGRLEKLLDQATGQKE